jgi:hypothetical protein
MVALCNPALKQLRGAFKTNEFDKEVEKLKLTATQRALLFDSVAFAKRLRYLYQPAPPVVLNRISNRIDVLLEELFFYFPPISLGMVFDQVGPQEMGPICGDFHLSAGAESELRRISAISKHMSDVIRRRKAPQVDYIGQIAYLWPAFYIESITGQPHYPEVAQLLNLAGFGEKQPEQLSKAAKSVRERSPSVAQWLVLLLPRLPGEIC